VASTTFFVGSSPCKNSSTSSSSSEENSCLSFSSFELEEFAEDIGSISSSISFSRTSSEKFDYTSGSKSSLGLSILWLSPIIKVGSKYLVLLGSLTDF
jgi:hypothetical protein